MCTCAKTTNLYNPFWSQSVHAFRARQPFGPEGFQLANRVWNREYARTQAPRRITWTLHFRTKPAGNLRQMDNTRSVRWPRWVCIQVWGLRWFVAVCWCTASAHASHMCSPRYYNHIYRQTGGTTGVSKNTRHHSASCRADAKTIRWWCIETSLTETDQFTNRQRTCSSSRPRRAERRLRRRPARAPRCARSSITTRTRSGARTWSAWCPPTSPSWVSTRDLSEWCCLDVRLTVSLIHSHLSAGPDQNATADSGRGDDQSGGHSGGVQQRQSERRGGRRGEGEYN